MDILLDLLKITATAFFTFCITCYSIKYNRPSKNMEIAYNRIYYPITRIINDDSLDLSVKVQRIQPYLEKYQKYANPSTLKSFRILYESLNDKKVLKTNYTLFTDNISFQCFKLRKILGYMNTNIFEVYSYSSNNQKYKFRLFAFFFVIYIIIFSVSLHILNVNIASGIVIAFILIILLDSIIHFGYIGFQNLCNKWKGLK